MRLVSLRIITNDIKRLVGFYEMVTGISLTWYTEEFAELKTEALTLAIGSMRTTGVFPAHAMRPAENHSAIIEFLVDDVEALYENLRDSEIDCVMPPTLMPWGNRSLLVRDPDGNLLNFFTPVSPEAIKKLSA